MHRRAVGKPVPRHAKQEQDLEQDLQDYHD